MTNYYSTKTESFIEQTITATYDIIDTLKESSVSQNDVSVYYDNNLDSLKVFLKDETGYTKKLNCYIDLSLSSENEIIGLTIHKVKELIHQKDII